jgi:hypothetical protein
MTTVNRMNMAISDHTVAANSFALGLLAVLCIVSAAAIHHSGNLAESSYSTLLRSMPTTQTTTAPAKAVVSTQTLPVLLNVSAASVTVQAGNTTAYLQPAGASLQSANTAAATLQPARSTVQLTATSDTLQNASVSLQ